jgi:flagellar biosynthetic protein FlhB
MSRDELRREHKEIEGDPLHKAERRRIHRELLEGRTLDEVREAKIVLVESGVMAIALQYGDETGLAPTVMAKSSRHQAERIEKIARSAGVPIFIEPDLIHVLAMVEEGEEIPESIFEEVAALLVQARIQRDSSHTTTQASFASSERS